MILLLTILPNVNIHLIIGRENLKILEKINSFYWSYFPLLILDNLIDVDDIVTGGFKGMTYEYLTFFGTHYISSQLCDLLMYDN
jgi:hypothetical protein